MTDFTAISGFQVYARFRHDIESLRFGPRGGLLAFVNGRWVRVRKSKAQKDAE